MKASSSSLVLLLPFLYSCQAVAKAAQRDDLSPSLLVQDDPTTFFGGTNNEEYVVWLNSDLSTLNHTVFVTRDDDETQGMAVHWTIVHPDKIRLAVAARATGWIAFGIAENGGMRGADIVTFEVSTESLMDRHVLNEIVKPIPDKCQSWRKTNQFVGDEFIILEMYRDLDTKDPQDRPITNDGNILIPPTRIIGAWGDDEELHYHGANRVRGAIRFFGQGNVGEERNQFYQTMQEESVLGSFVMHASSYEIPHNKDTTYARFCYNTTMLRTLGVPIDEPLHIIGMEPVLDPITGAKHVHHFGVTGVNFVWEGDGCDTFFEMEPVYMWAAGEPPFALPPEVGISIGKNGLLAFQFEIHYDNRLLEAGVFDSSGVRMYYTTSKRPYDMGIFSTGDPTFELKSDVGLGISRHEFTCPSSCTNFVASQNLTVIREFLHMHEGGVAMYNEQIRNGQVLRKASVDFFEYQQQGLFAVIQEPYQIIPGDSFHTVCHYQTDHPRRFGLGSQEEMCITSIWYYPKQVKDLFPLTCGFFQGWDLPAMKSCIVDHKSQLLNNSTELGRSFGEPKRGAWCPVPPLDPEVDGCLSGTSTLELQGQGTVAMRDVRLGDKVLVVDDTYEVVYSFAHKSTSQRSEFLQFLPSRIEVTPNHLMLVEGKGMIPASHIVVGDVLMDSGSVTSIRKVVRYGLYAPLTSSGTITVNGARISCYVAFGDSATLEIGTWITPFTYHWLEHMYQAPHRLYCGILGCTHETYSEDGVSSWHVVTQRVWRNLRRQHPAVMVIVLVPIIVFLSLFQATSTTLVGLAFCCLASWFALRSGTRIRRKA